METETRLSRVWDQHVGAEFSAKSADDAVAAMTATSYVNLIPLMIGARGRDQVRDFYADHFVSQLPPDIEVVNVSRTIGQERPILGGRSRRIDGNLLRKIARKTYEQAPLG